jgi:hypothetical protein
MIHRRLRVRLETERHIIEGTLQLPGEGYRSRLTDFFCAHEGDFVPVTDAELTWIGGERAPEHHEYVTISVRHVTMGVELEDLGTFDAMGEPPGTPMSLVSTPPPGS